MEDKYHWLEEDLKSIRNRCDIGIILITLERYDLLPTILEDLHSVSQHIIDDHCVQRVEESPKPKDI